MWKSRRLSSHCWVARICRWKLRRNGSSVMRNRALGLSATLVLEGAALLQGQAKLPDGAAILDRYVEVTGGKAAYQKIKSECDKTVVGPEDGPHFSVTACTARGGKKGMVTETAWGGAEGGVNDQIGWGLSPVSGGR